MVDSIGIRGGIGRAPLRIDAGAKVVIEHGIAAEVIEVLRARGHDMSADRCRRLRRAQLIYRCNYGTRPLDAAPTTCMGTEPDR